MRLRSSPPPLPRLLFLPRLLRPAHRLSPFIPSLPPSPASSFPPRRRRRPSATATPSSSSAPEPSIRLFARNRFHVFGPLLHLYKRARTTNIGHCARDVMDVSSYGACPRPYPSSPSFVFLILLPGLIVAHLSVDSADLRRSPNSTRVSSRTTVYNNPRVTIRRKVSFHLPRLFDFYTPPPPLLL